MNWTALGALGEMIGGVVVVVTLIYLAVQIRQNTNATAAQATAYVASEMERNLLALAENAGLAEAYLKTMQGEELSPLEATRLLFWWGAFVRSAESHVLQTRLGVVRDDHAAPIAVILRGFTAVPLFRASLQQMVDQRVQTQGFRDWVSENVLGRAEP